MSRKLYNQWRAEDLQGRYLNAHTMAIMHEQRNGAEGGPALVSVDDMAIELAARDAIIEALCDGALKIAVCTRDVEVVRDTVAMVESVRGMLP